MSKHLQRMKPNGMVSYCVVAIDNSTDSREESPEVEVMEIISNPREVKPTVAVTGGAGFIGSHFTLELLYCEYEVVVIDNCSNCQRGVGEEDMPESLVRVQRLAQRRVRYYDIDIMDRRGLKRVFRRNPDIKVVVHFAALKAVGESMKYPLAYYSNNVTGTITLLEVMRKYGVTNLVFSSSATVYGLPSYLPVDENHPVGISVTNPYGRTKSFTEDILKDLSNSSSEWKIISLRYFNPVGAHNSGLIGEDPVGIPNNLMPFVARTAVGNLTDLKVYGGDYDTPDGTGLRDYIHVMDLVKGHVKAVEKLDYSGPGFVAYNLGSGRPYSVLDVIMAFSDVCGRQIPYRFVDRRPGDVPAIYANADLAARELGWRATHTLHDMCLDTYRWQYHNPNGYRK